MAVSFVSKAPAQGRSEMRCAFRQVRQYEFLERRALGYNAPPRLFIPLHGDKGRSYAMGGQILKPVGQPPRPERVIVQDACNLDSEHLVCATSFGFSDSAIVHRRGLRLRFTSFEGGEPERSVP